MHLFPLIGQLIESNNIGCINAIQKIFTVINVQYILRIIKKGKTQKETCSLKLTHNMNYCSAMQVGRVEIQIEI